MRQRVKLLWAGVRRGARFGAIVGAVIWLCLQLVLLCFLILVPELRANFMSNMDDYEYPILAMIGSTAATFALMAFYGAAGGAVVVGIAGMLRADDSASPNPRWQFSLRTLLFGMTVVAAILGLVIWAAKK
jgi:hypothetical protein